MASCAKFYQLQFKRSFHSVAHPASRFSVGNKSTLQTNPAAQGIDLRKSLLEFHSTYYVAPLMTLAVTADLPLSELERLVVKAFSKIPTGSGAVAEPALQWWGKVPLASVATLLGMVPDCAKEDFRPITIRWPIWLQSPAEHAALLRAKPDVVIAHLLGM